MKTTTALPPRRLKIGHAGFSLLELLVVIALIALLTILMVPSIEGFASSGGRKGAVIIVMNALENARVTAISRNEDVRVYLWKKNGNAAYPADESDALIITNGSQNPYSRWIRLPRGVLFSDGGLIHTPVSQTLDLPGKPPGDKLFEIRFTSAGSLSHNSEPIDQLFIALTEGQRNESGSMAVSREKDGGQEIIGLARLTGRASLDISTL